MFSVSAETDSFMGPRGLEGASLLIPILLIIIPVVYTSLRLQFYDYFLVENEGGAIASIKKSINITQGYAGELFVLGAVLSIIILISIIPLMVGLIFSIPLVIMVNTHVYLKLKNAH